MKDLDIREELFEIHLRLDQILARIDPYARHDATTSSRVGYAHSVCDPLHSDTGSLSSDLLESHVVMIGDSDYIEG